MSATRRTALAVGERLPAATLRTVDGEHIDLHRTRHETSVLVFPHPGCDACLAHVARFDALTDRLTAWGGRVLVLPSDPVHASTLSEQVAATVAVDDDAALRAAAGLGADQAAIVVADRFGTVYRSEPAGDGHGLVDPDDLLEQIRYMGSQCPECGVPDDPLRGEESWVP